MLKLMHVEAGMKVYGGARQVIYLVEGLRARGIDCVLVCPIGAAIGTQLASSGVAVAETRLGGDLDFGFIGRLRRLIRTYRPDLVHLHSRRGADVLGGIACRLEGVPVVHSRRNENPEMPWFARIKYRLYDRVIGISEAIRSQLLSYGLSEQQVRMVRSAFAPDPAQTVATRLEMLDEFGLPADAFVIGVVAQLIERKGHRFLIQAMPDLLARYPGLFVLCFGQGAMQATLEAQARSLGVAQRVRFVGFRNDLLHWLGRLDLVAHPALMEGLGVALLQASSLGIPIVAARAGGIPEAVRDGINGLLVEPGDVAALGGAVSQLVGDEPLRRRLGAAGRELIAREFSVDTMVEDNLAIYHAVLAERAARRRR
ncbi:MAG: glycosyltransferase [Panacagrimonas sp.]